MGIEPIAELLAERDELVEQVADLRARFGPGGTWNDLRKVKLAALAQIKRAAWTREGLKFTEAMVDEAAHADPSYVDEVIGATRARADWVRLENRIQGIEETINRGQAVARYVTSELHLSPQGA